MFGMAADTSGRPDIGNTRHTRMLIIIPPIGGRDQAAGFWSKATSKRSRILAGCRPWHRGGSWNSMAGWADFHGCESIFVQKRIDDGDCGLGTARRPALSLASWPGDPDYRGVDRFISQGDKIVAFYGYSFFQEVVAVAVFLTRIRGHDNHRKAGRHGFGCGQSARFADAEIGHLHPMMYFVRVAQHTKPSLGLLRRNLPFQRPLFFLKVRFSSRGC
jgi:hypothetical protein